MQAHKVAFWVAHILALECCVLHAQPPDLSASRTLVFERDVNTLSHWNRFPKFSGQLLIWCENNFTSGPLIEIVDKNSVHDELLFSLPDGAKITISDMAAAVDGEIAIVGTAWTMDRPSRAFLVRISPDRQHQTITKLWPYHPEVVTFAPHGVIWTAGWVSDDDNLRVVTKHVARRYGSDGKMISETVIHVPDWRTGHVTYLVASQDRVGWFNDGSYIEFALDGKEIAGYDGPEGDTLHDLSGVALSDQNDVVVGRFSRKKAEFDLLDRENGTWIPASMEKERLPSWARVLGFDRATLVVTSKTMGVLSRFNVQIDNK